MEEGCECYRRGEKAAGLPCKVRRLRPRAVDGRDVQHPGGPVLQPPGRVLRLPPRDRQSRAGEGETPVRRSVDLKAAIDLALVLVLFMGMIACFAYAYSRVTKHPEELHLLLEQCG